MRPRLLLTLSVAALALAQTGCCRRVVSKLRGSDPAAGRPTSPVALPSEPAGPQAAPGPVTLTWTAENLAISTGGTGRIFTMGDDGKVMVTVSGVPKGSVVSAGDAKETAGPTGHASLRVDVRKAIGTAKTDTSATYTIPDKLTVTLPDGRSGSADFPEQKLNMFALSKFFKGAIGPGLTFEGEPADAKRDIAYFAYAGGRFLGRAGTLREVDLVVDLEKGAEKGTKICKGYKASGGSGPEKSLTVRLIEGVAVAYDRRTGKEVSRKVFPPSGTCPMFAMHNKGDDTIDSTLPSTDVEAWAKKLLR